VLLRVQNWDPNYCFRRSDCSFTVARVWKERDSHKT